MAPRKTNKEKETTPKKPVPRKRVQQKKPLKTPTLLKLKITNPKPDPDSSTPKLMEKQLGVQRKIDLANEVALAQLYKNAEIIDNVTTTEPEKKKTKSKRNTKATPPSKPQTRQKRQKTISEFFNDTAEADSAVVSKQTPKKIIRKTPGPKKRKTEISCPQIKSADSTVCKARRPPKKQKETTSVSCRNLRSKKQADVCEGGGTNGDSEARAAAVSSRTNSGASSTPSWTRDISSSSTTTCVTVGDFVRIDQRLPVLQLPDIAASCAHTIAPASIPTHTPSSGSGSASSSTSSSTSSSSSSSSLSSPDATGTEAASPALVSPPALFPRPTADNLNLSISSSERMEETAPVANIPSELDDLFSQLIEGQKKLDRTFEDWMNQLDEPDSCDTDSGVARALNDLSLEPILLECRRVRQILRGEEEEEEEEENENGDVKVDEPVIKASTQSCEDHLSGLYGRVTKNSVVGNYEDDEVSCDDNYTHFDHSPDDEDAISLFAESTFTDCGSSRRDEYVPRPIALPTAARPSCTRVYKPTPIATQPPPPRENSAPASGSPLLIADLHQPVHGTKSAVFHGVCFYYAAGGKCRNAVCRYLHVDIAVEEVDRRIATLGEADFIQEYMLIRAWPSLWRLYAPRYLCEAERRELTRLLLEMAMDFTMKARPRSHEDYLQREAALEAALTRLSCDEGGVRACADLLRLQVSSATTGKRPLQYLLLHTLANTANFSRFKRAFIELAALLVDIGERLEPGPVVKILERVCILPYEERLVRAMLALVRLTDAAAVAPFMPQFQTLVAALPEETSDEPPPVALDIPPPSPVNGPPPPTAIPPLMKKPMITRTVDFLRQRGYPPPRQFRGQWNHSRGRATSRGTYLPTYPGYQHSPIYRRRPSPRFPNLN